MSDQTDQDVVNKMENIMEKRNITKRINLKEKDNLNLKEQLDDKIKGIEEKILESVRMYGHNIQKIGFEELEKLLSYDAIENICIEACKSSGRALIHVPQKYRTIKVQKHAVMRNPRSLKLVNLDLYKDNPNYEKIKGLFVLDIYLTLHHKSIPIGDGIIIDSRFINLE